jgi:hypothetical protein
MSPSQLRVASRSEGIDRVGARGGPDIEPQSVTGDNINRPVKKADYIVFMMPFLAAAVAARCRFSPGEGRDWRSW